MHGITEYEARAAARRHLADRPHDRDDGDGPGWPYIYASAMKGEIDPDEAFLALMEISDALHVHGDHRQAEHVSDCAARLYEDKIPGGIVGAVASAREAHRHLRLHCRVIILRGRRRGRAGRRRVGSRLAAKAASAGDPDPEPPRSRCASSSRGAA